MRTPLVLALLLAAPTAPQGPTPAENVLLVTLDGLRWQEVFRGAEEALLTKEAGGVANAAALKRDFSRETPEARREALMPFLWSVVAKQGQVLGNPDKGCRAVVTNGKKFSYPGYSEMLCGFPDAAIDSNDKKPNRNVTVLEWLHRKPAFAGRVATFASWAVVPFILNRERSGMLVNAGFEPLEPMRRSERLRAVNDLLAQTTPSWEDTRHDSFTFELAKEHLAASAPRVLYVHFSETDSWAHEGRYDRYLHAARAADGWIRALWELAQSKPETRGKIALLVTTDHGRGDGPKGWKTHGEKVDGAEAIWIAALGPGVAPLGERANEEGLTQARIATTLAALVGEDFAASEPKAAKAIELGR